MIGLLLWLLLNVWTEASTQLDRLHHLQQLFKPGKVRGTKTPVIPTFIAYTYGYQFLKQTLESYARSHWPYIIILDNSNHKDALHDYVNLRLQYNISGVIETSTRLTFTQLQQTMAFYAEAWDLPYYFWAHGDSFLVPLTSHPYEDANQCIQQEITKKGQMTVVFFAYDYVSALNTTLVQEVKWDTGITHYLSDCDFYYRLEARANQRSGECYHALGEVFNDWEYFLTDYDRQILFDLNKHSYSTRYNHAKVLLEKGKQTKGSYAFRSSVNDSTAMTIYDQVAYEELQTASRNYYYRKHGITAHCGLKESRNKDYKEFSESLMEQRLRLQSEQRKEAK